MRDKTRGQLAADQFVVSPLATRKRVEVSFAPTLTGFARVAK